MTSSSMIIDNNHSDTLLVSFAGHDMIYGQTPRFSFVQLFETHFKSIDRHFYIDIHVNSYHKGIGGISKSIDETVTYLQKQIAPYKKTIFIGTSAGGYAAILFGSLLRVTSVLAFIPQTLRRHKLIDEKYRDISSYINDTTNYYLYADLSITNPVDPHHISQCERIACHPNVYIIKKNKFNIKQIRDDGEMYEVINKLINE